MNATNTRTESEARELARKFQFGFLRQSDRDATIGRGAKLLGDDLWQFSINGMCVVVDYSRQTVSCPSLDAVAPFSQL